METGQSRLLTPALRRPGSIGEVAGVVTNSIHIPEISNLLMEGSTRMKRSLNIRILALTISLLLGALPIAAAERAFALHGNGNATFITDGAGHIIGANITSSGTATHLGLWSSVGTLQFTPDPNNPNLILVTGTATVTAANGDKLQAVIADSVLDGATGLAKGVYRIVGGTGRFEGASGAPNFVVTQNLVTGAFEVTAVGSINF